MVKHEDERRGLVRCPVSKRIEGTRNMQGKVCSFCGKPTQP